MENPERTSFLPLVERTEWSSAESRDACAAMNRWTDAVEKVGSSLAWRRPVTDSTVRVAVKDVLDVARMPTSYGLKTGKRQIADSTVTAAQGFPEQTLIGKAATTELGIGLEHGCVNLAYPHVDPGGSSTGSAVAVASGVCDIALGTDSVASVRIPAAATGIVGLRTSDPSSALQPGFSLSDRLDAPGWFARTPADLAFAWERWIRPGQRISPEIEGVQFEIIEEAVAGVLDVEMAHALHEASDALTRSGAAGRDASIGELFAARRLAYEACVADARASVEKLPWVKQLLSGSTARALSTDLTSTAQELSARLVELRSSARNALEDGRIWLLPAGAQLPLDLRTESLPDSTIPTEHAGSMPAPINYFATAAMLRLPSISIPLGIDQRDLPMSVQLIGGPGSDALLVSMAWAITNRLGTPDLASKCLQNLGALL